jgi:SAM-dependent methyltransferase
MNIWNFYNSNKVIEYYNISETWNKSFQNTKEFIIMNKYIEKNFKICEFWAWEWGKIATFNNIKNNLKLFWIDISEYGLKKASEKYKNIKFTIWDITNTKYKNEFFDITMSFFVYEHLDNPLLAFKEMYRITKNWGYIFLWFPNYWSPLFPSPPTLYKKNNIQKIWIILRRIFWRKKIYKNVIPIIDDKFKADFDTMSEINMWKFTKYIKKNYNISIIEYSSNWDLTNTWNPLFKLYFPFKLFKSSIFKYWWPQCFLIIKKK